ncbi:MAG: hypothetical protein LBH24_03440 [Clostridiales bacterium]|jgi:hypothetical protein|nr:hypothetical protein [Clostridiales bacterium]
MDTQKNANDTQKKGNPLTRLLRLVFVKDWALKLFSLLFAAALWLLMAGFTPIG